MPVGQFAEVSADYTLIWLDSTAIVGGHNNALTNGKFAIRLDEIVGYNDDTIPHSFDVGTTRDGTAVIFSFTVPAGAGTPGVPPWSLVGSGHLPGLSSINFSWNAQLDFRLREAINAPHHVGISVFGGYFE